MSDPHDPVIAALNQHLAAINTLFGVPIEVTLLIRVPSEPEAGILMTTDPIKVVMAELYRISDRPPIYNKGDEIPL